MHADHANPKKKKKKEEEEEESWSLIFNALNYLIKCVS
jgi:hypothetical protein